VVLLADPWGPGRKKRLTGLQSYLRELYVAPTNEVKVEAEYDGGRPLLSQEQVSVMFAAMDSAGLLHRLVNTSGQITEANSSSISTSASSTMNALRHDRNNPLFGAAPSPAATYWDNAAPRLFQTTLTATAGGEIVAADVGPPTLASYQACMIITHWWSDQTQANITMAVTASAGALSQGLATFDLSTTANTITPDWHQGLAWQAGTDAATIQLSCAAGQAGNAQNITACGIYWYET